MLGYPTGIPFLVLREVCGRSMVDPNVEDGRQVVKCFIRSLAGDSLIGETVPVASEEDES